MTLRGSPGAVVGGRYQLISVLGQGGMGRVWRAADTLLGREIAVKEVLLPEGVAGTERQDLIRRAVHEARAASRLQHPNIVAVHDVVNEGDVPWIVMDLVQGPSFGSVLRQSGRIGWERAAAIGRDLADALAHAHGLGVVHRDLKPDNILISAERPVLTDFSIARVLDGTTHLTRTGSMIGTPQYMSPEQVEGKAAGTPSDLWSLGVTLYTALEGRNPFTRDNLGATYAAILTQPPQQPTQAGAMTGLLMELLRRDPAERPSAAYTAEALRGLTNGGRPSGPRPQDNPAAPAWTPAPPPGPTAPNSGYPAAPTASEDFGTLGGPQPARPTRRRAAAYSAAAVVLAALAGVLVMVLPSSPSSHNGTPPGAGSSGGADGAARATGVAQVFLPSTTGYTSEGAVYIEDSTGYTLDLNPDDPQSGPLVTSEQQGIKQQAWEEYENSHGQLFFLNEAYPDLALTVGPRSDSATSEQVSVRPVVNGSLSEDQLWWQGSIKSGVGPYALQTVETVNSSQGQACLNDEGDGNTVDVSVCTGDNTIPPTQQWSFVSAAASPTPGDSGS